MLVSLWHLPIPAALSTPTAADLQSWRGPGMHHVLKLSSPCPPLTVQLTADADEAASMDHYMRKTYCKTASLMANSCKAVAVLGGNPAGDCQLAAEYGRHLGLAFQLVDDIMDFTSTGAHSWVLHSSRECCIAGLQCSASAGALLLFANMP